MRKPIIGITIDAEPDPSNQRSLGRFVLNWNYVEEIVKAGGAPVLIPPIADMTAIANVIDGWLIPGGRDIDASRFGQANHPKAELQEPCRYEAEKQLLEALAPEVPVLGICYGCQFLNVAGGGTLIQHLPDKVGHDEHSGGTLQPYKLESSELRRIVGTERVEGRSYHHQAIDRLAPKLRAVAAAEDGVIEAVEATDRPWMIGVQWHPERTADDEASRRLFAAFIEAASRSAQSRSCK